MSDNNKIALRMPEPNWRQDAAKELESKCKSVASDYKQVDSIKTRKDYNKEESDFIKAFVMNIMTKMDTLHRVHVEAETKRINTLMTSVKDMLSMELQMTMSLEDKKKLIEDANIPQQLEKISFYMFESDLSGLNEAKTLQNMIQNGTSAMASLSNDKLDDYMMRLSNRIVQESPMTFEEYTKQLDYPLTIKIENVEYLGHLRKFRKRFFGYSRASEGDYKRNSSRSKEAYDEDIVRYDYTFDSSEGKLRQRTVKFTVLLKNEPIKVPYAQEILKTIFA